MTELRQRMIECLQLRGLAERTQEAYVRAVRQLSEHDHKAPDLITPRTASIQHMSNDHRRHLLFVNPAIPEQCGCH